MSMIWVVVLICVVVVYFVITIFHNKLRASVNFNTAYFRALRIEGNKEVAISRALQHLRTFLSPFDGLSDTDITEIAKLFADVDEPHKALQPPLQHAYRSRTIVPYMKLDSLKGWKEKWAKTHIAS